MEDDELGHAFDEWRGVIYGELMWWMMMGVVLDTVIDNVVIVSDVRGGGVGWRHDAVILGTAKLC